MLGTVWHRYTCKICVDGTDHAVLEGLNEHVARILPVEHLQKAVFNAFLFCARRELASLCDAPF